MSTRPTTLHVARLEERTVPAGVVTGTVFLDYNSNGVFDTTGPTITNAGDGTPLAVATDVGFGPGVVVTAFDSANTVRGTTTTNFAGQYSLPLSGTGPYRLEFTGLPAGATLTGPSGVSTGTSVQFIADPAGGTTPNVNLSVVRADTLGTNNPLLATSQYVEGAYNGTNAALPAVVSFAYNAGSATSGNTQGPGYNTPATHAVAIPQSQVGATWGLAYSQTSRDLYMAAFFKRHSGFGPAGSGAIYAAAIPAAAGQTVTTAALVADLGTAAGGADYRNVAGYDFLTDGLANNQSWDAVGKYGLGGLDVSPNGQFLYTVGLADRRFYVVNAATGAFQSFALPVPNDPATGVTGVSGEAPLGDLRPFAVTYYQGAVYVGAVNSAESTTLGGTVTGDPTRLRAYVFKFDPATNQFVDLTGAATTTTPVLNVSLDYTRGYAHPTAGPGNAPVSADWLPWSPVYKNLGDGSFANGKREEIYPQPEFTGLTFDDSGNMVLGLRDRLGDQAGALTPVNPANPTFFQVGITAGDTLRAFANAPGNVSVGWTLENNGAGPGGTPASAQGVGNGQGPGGGEYYSDDYLQPGLSPTLDDHQEVSDGGVLQIPGFPDVAVTSFDPAQVRGRYNAGGVRWYSNGGATAGEAVKAYELYYDGDLAALLAQGITPPTFAKSNGVGDLVALSNSTEEIGNRVWVDANKNGIQDPGEPGLAGVQVNLYDTLGNQIGTTTTDANGNYYFSNSAAPASPSDAVPGKAYLDPTVFFAGGQYQVRIPLGQSALQALTLTTANVNGNGSDTIDSDATAVGTDGVIPIAALGIAENNHTYDAGFVSNLSLGDYVWNDLNNDGQWEAGEPALAGVTVDLFDGAGNLLQSTTTNTGGGYLFTGLNPGQYQIRIPTAQVALTGFVSSTGTNNAYEPAAPINPANNFDHGTTQGTVVVGPVVTLAVGTAPTGETGTAPGGLGLTDPASDGNSDRTQDFGFFVPPPPPPPPPTFSLGDYVWRDTNNDGQWESGEPALAGVTVQLFDGSGNLLQTTTTNASGGYLFTGLAAGQYQVRIPAGQSVLSGLLSSTGANNAYEPVAPINPANDFDHGTTLTDGTVVGPVVTLAAGTAPTGETAAAPGGLGLTDPAADANSDRTQDFGFFSPPPPPPPPATFSLGDYVWNDLNNDGQWESGEPVLAGVTVQLFDGAGTFLQTTTTNANGGYLFTGLAAGQYQIRIPLMQAALTGFVSSTGANNAYEPGSPINPANDFDHGTTQGSVVIGPVVTLAAGTAPTGETAAAPGGLGLTDPAADANSDRTQDFGFFSPPPPPPPPPSPPLAQISGYVYLDYNVNGAREPGLGEKGLGGTEIILDGVDASGNPVAERTTYTDTNGFYQFLSLPAGQYVVREVQPNGYLYNVLSTPGTVGGTTRGTAGNDVLQAITLNAGDAGIEYNFGELPPTGLFGYVWFDGYAGATDGHSLNGVFDAGEAPIPGVTVTISGTAFAGTPFARPLTAADVPGGLTAVTNSAGRYDFPVLPQGTYTVSETQPTDYDDWLEQNGAPSGPAPTISNDVFSNVVLNHSFPIRGPFNFGEALSSSNQNLPPAPLTLPSKRDFLSSTPPRTGGTSTSESLPPQTAPGVNVPVANLTLQPQFAVATGTPTQPAYVAAGNGPGTSPLVRVFNYATGVEAFRFEAYEPGYTGGVRTAVGDVTGDGVADIVTATGLGGGPRVRVFNGRDGSPVQDFFAYEPTYTGGVNVAVADVNGDGYADVITGTDGGGAPRVRVFSGKDGSVLADFFAFDQTQRSGVRVAAADFNGDGHADIVVTTGAGPQTRVRVFDGLTNAVLADYTPYGAFTGGAYVTAGDFDGDGTPDVIVGADAGGTPLVRVFSGLTQTNLTSFFAVDPSFTGGVRVAALDVTGDGKADVIAGAGTGGAARVTIYSGPGVSVVDDFFAFDATATDGVYVGAGTTAAKTLPTTGTPVLAGALGKPGTLPTLPSS